MFDVVKIWLVETSNSNAPGRWHTLAYYAELDAAMQDCHIRRAVADQRHAEIWAGVEDAPAKTNRLFRVREQEVRREVPGL